MLGRSLLLKVRRPQPVYLDYVQEYINRVIAADVAAGNNNGLEDEVTDAISTCLQAMVADGVLGVSGGALSQSASLIKAGCFMMGARTLSGALVPLAADMPAPTNINLAAGDYNRKTGIQFGATGKYLSLNVDNANSVYGTQNNKHLAVFVPLTSSNFSRTYIGGGNSGIRVATSLSSYLGVSLNSTNTNVADTHALSDAAFPFMGISRSASADYALRARGTGLTVSRSSSTPVAGNYILAWNEATSYTNCRISCYSIGQALDLAILDARITALSNAIAAAIP